MFSPNYFNVRNLSTCIPSFSSWGFFLCSNQWEMLFYMLRKLKLCYLFFWKDAIGIILHWTDPFIACHPLKFLSYVFCWRCVDCTLDAFLGNVCYLWQLHLTRNFLAVPVLCYTIFFRLAHMWRLFVEGTASKKLFRT